MTDLARQILHAESYPFARPACSYLFDGGMMRPLSPGAMEGRLPVVASGSNASPSRLAAKFGDREKIPVTRAELRDFAVVFAGHFTRYGAIPATLCPHHGAVTDVWITWLSPAQLEVMHRSEGVIDCREAEQRYDFFELTGLDLRPAGLAPIDRAGAYLARRMFSPAGEAMRFAEIAAHGSSLSARSHRAALRQAAALLEPEEPYQTFMASVLSGTMERQTLFERLTPNTLPRKIGASP